MTDQILLAPAMTEDHGRCKNEPCKQPLSAFDTAVGDGECEVCRLFRYAGQDPVGVSWPERRLLAALSSTRPDLLVSDYFAPQYEVIAGGHRRRIDLVLVALLPAGRKIGIEVDGFPYHSSQAALTSDHRRQRDIWRDSRFTLLRFSAQEINVNPLACAEEIWRVYEAECRALLAA